MSDVAKLYEEMKLTSMRIIQVCRHIVRLICSKLTKTGAILFTIHTFIRSSHQARIRLFFLCFFAIPLLRDELSDISLILQYKALKTYNVRFSAAFAPHLVFIRLFNDPWLLIHVVPSLLTGSSDVKSSQSSYLFISPLIIIGWTILREGHYVVFLFCVFCIFLMKILAFMLVLFLIGKEFPGNFWLMQFYQFRVHSKSTR